MVKGQMTKNIRCVLGFDYGSKRIGVAVGQTITATASPLTSVAVRHNQPEWNNISKLIQTWQPDALIVGLPLHQDGAESAVSKAARDFSAQLQQRYRLPVYLADEYLSSFAAAERTDGELHPVAAQIILETWLHDRAYAA